MSKLLDQKILEALLSEPSVASVARAAGCSRDSVYARLRDPAFLERLEAALDARRTAISAEAVTAHQRACERLRDILDSPLSTSTRDQLKAVELALRFLQH